ncbi:MAG: phosphoesterase [Candidatus Rokuibacteriota bacterium]|nr:MAG: phosphoesterase [Candidatus Rokubacteria bacterium]
MFLILMENTDWSSIKGSSSAPYINSLLSGAAHAEQYNNPPNNHPSLPNYLWLEAGTNFGISSDPNPPQRTSSPHLSSMLDAAGISWKTYQEDEGSGAYDGSDCPNYGEGNWYDVNHNPFVYFTDVTNNTTYCKAHVRPYSEFPTDLASNNVPRYNFIVPDLCHDMHENISCSQSNRIRFGDTWLSTEVPKILASPAYLNSGALFITWDEGASGDGPIGMIVLSPKGKRGYSNTTTYYDHSSTLRTMQEIFGVSPMIRDAANATDLRDLFVSFP